MYHARYIFLLNNMMQNLPKVKIVLKNQVNKIIYEDCMGMQ